MTDIFISYSRRQSKDVRAVMDEIEKLPEPFTYWFDKKNIHPTTQWWDEICEGIEQAKLFVAFISEAYIDSPICLTELNYAKQLGKPILLMVIRHIRPQKWDSFFVKSFAQFHVPIDSEENSRDELPVNISASRRASYIQFTLTDISPSTEELPQNHTPRPEIRTDEDWFLYLFNEFEKYIEDMVANICGTPFDLHFDKRDLKTRRCISGYITKPQFKKFIEALQEDKLFNDNATQKKDGLTDDNKRFLAQKKGEIISDFDKLADNAPVGNMPYYVVLAYCSWLEYHLNGLNCTLPTSDSILSEWLHKEGSITDLTLNMPFATPKIYNVPQAFVTPPQPVYFRVLFTLSEIPEDKAVIPTPENHLYLESPSGSFFIRGSKITLKEFRDGKREGLSEDVIGAVGKYIDENKEAVEEYIKSIQ